MRSSMAGPATTFGAAGGDEALAAGLLSNKMKVRAFMKALREGGMFPDPSAGEVFICSLFGAISTFRPLGQAFRANSTGSFCSNLE